MTDWLAARGLARLDEYLTALSIGLLKLVSVATKTLVADEGSSLTVVDTVAYRPRAHRSGRAQPTQEHGFHH